MDKQLLKDALLASLDDEIASALAAAGEAQATASHGENKPENQYDTLALEAAYLAHGQSERILALQQLRIGLSKWKAPQLGDDDRVQMGACVQLLSDTDATIHIFIAPVGGRELNLDGQRVLVVNQDAPITRRLLGLMLDDEVELTLGGEARTWEVTGLY
ncbi:GreA/GreB family elongation factor [Thalassolituus sp.]|uniref:GreA/GreB family elongation factor n=1 Tax=Thalassolituus sp. TaxID=2030822 RepID=UPI00351198F9